MFASCDCEIPELIGCIEVDACIFGSLELEPSLLGTLTSDAELTGQVDGVSYVIGGEEYEGSYVITPDFEKQVLPTKDKVLIQDMTVLEIPYHETTNIYGGYTAVIGGY